MSKLLDIHSHNFKVDNSNQLRFIVGKHSLGIHPWELTAPFNETLNHEKFLNLKKQFNQKILAIGECGLDRRRSGIAELASQERVLSWHMDWALEVKRPLIIHCVKAEADLLKILKSRHFKGRILLHDFSGNHINALALLKYDCFFSFGCRIFNPSSKAAMVMKSMPRDKIFLETDNQKEYSLEMIYQKAQEVLNLNQKKSEELFMQNLANFFADLDNISSTDIINDLSTSFVS